ncbi:MAG: Ku protein [Bacteroidetes bacterium]|nr:MAG: Ku protein [Bacteroidota bacterium]
MRAIWTGTIGFGLVNIPVKLYSAVQDSELDLDMLDSKDHSNIRYVRVNDKTGKEVPWKSIVKGYKIDNKYVVLTDEDFEKASPKKTKTIEITDFVNQDEIGILYYEMPYYLEPESSGTKAYALLREALKKTGKVAVGNFVMRSKQSLVVLKEVNGALALIRLRYYEEVRDIKDLKIPGKVTISAPELKMATALIQQYTTKFDISDYKDTYTAELMKLIKAKSRGIKIKVPEMRVVHKDTRDLMSQLKASLNTPKKKKAS